jgi:hypothetical protein
MQAIILILFDFIIILRLILGLFMLNIVGKITINKTHNFYDEKNIGTKTF